MIGLTSAAEATVIQKPMQNRRAKIMGAKKSPVYVQETGAELDLERTNDAQKLSKQKQIKSLGFV